jgi:hypothetical protein
MSLQILLMSPRVLLAFAAVTSMCFDQERLQVYYITVIRHFKKRTSNLSSIKSLVSLGQS